MARNFDEITALLGSGTRFDGKLTFEGTVRIDGIFIGEILSSDVLIVGEGAEVRAEVRVGTLIVQGGVIHGDIHAVEQVEIHYPGKVHGNIISPSLFIDKGVIFEGECRMDPGPEVPVSSTTKEG
ncbi:MAG: polymer-forming cytoskeletal protein [Deltaproteobacteria bacterium]|nr:polymer-forming cytoskeletal protein [Deltaproteobacteria bacterium]